MGKQARNALHHNHDKQAIDASNNQLVTKRSHELVIPYSISSKLFIFERRMHLQLKTLTWRTKFLLPSRANTEITYARWFWSSVSLQPPELLLGLSRRAHDRIILYFAQRCTSFGFTLYWFLFCCMVDQSILLICDTLYETECFLTAF
jgi:hypothetical protein